MWRDLHLRPGVVDVARKSRCEQDHDLGTSEWCGRAQTCRELVGLGRDSLSSEECVNSPAAFAMLLVAVAVVGCMANEPDAGQRLTVDTTASGTIVVAHDAASASRSPARLDLELVRSVGLPGKGDASLGQPTGIAVDSRGNVLILDNKPVGVKVYTPDGRWLRTIGRDGAGPGEFRPHASLYVVRDTILVHDIAQSRMVVFSSTGDPLDVFPTTFLRGGFGPPDTLGRLLLPVRVGALLAAIRISAAGPTGDTLTLPPENAPRLWRAGSAAWPIPFQPRTVSRLAPNGELVWGHQERTRIHRGLPEVDTSLVVDGPHHDRRTGVYRRTSGTAPFVRSCVSPLDSPESLMRRRSPLCAPPGRISLWTLPVVCG